MQLVEGWTVLAERVGPMLVVPVASAIAVTLLWALTGWGWFDVGPWPWALAAVPVAALSAVRLVSALRQRDRVHQAVIDLGAALGSLGAAVPPGAAGPMIAVVRLARARLGRDGLQSMADVLPDESLQQVRQSADPLSAALAQVQAASDGQDIQQPLAAVRGALVQVQASAVPAAADLPSLALTTLYLATLPVGLVTTTGWWTLLAVAGIALAFLTVEAWADGLGRSLGVAGGVPADALLELTERSLPVPDAR